MRLRSGAFSRYRPRILTLIVLLVVAAPTVLANLIPTDVVQSSYAGNDFEYGWPLIWFWRNLAAKARGTQFEWQVLRYSWPQLAGNLAIWSVMLALAVTASEWLARRYRLRLRWSLRTMLAAIGVLAVLCAWCAMLRERASVQDVLIAAIEQEHGGVYLKRWGPDWLDLVGADRFRRRIIGVKLWRYGEIEDLLKRIGRLPNLRHLDLEAGEWTPGMSAALADMRQLRSLRIAVKADEHNSDAVLAAIGKLNQLKVLSLSDMIIASDNLSHLAALTDLRSLRLEIACCGEGEQDLDATLLAHLPALPRLESIGLHCGLVRVHHLRQLAALPRLKALDLTHVLFTDAALAELPSLRSLEELAIDTEVASATVLESLVALKRLQALHVHSGDLDSSLIHLPPDKNGGMRVPESAVDRRRQALEALRHSNPGIVIDSDTTSFDERHIWHAEFDDAEFRCWPADRVWPPGIF